MTTDALLAAVYADPLDDGPRAVLADRLLEEERPLGEFIQLQLARARGKKGLAAREKRLFNPAWWPDHPVSLGGGGAVRYEHTSRGFPVRFAPAMFVSNADRRDQVNGWQALAGKPGWATVETIGLRSLQGVGPVVLKSLLKQPLLGSQIRELDVHWSSDTLPPSLSTLTGLRSLSWWDRPALEVIERLGVLDRLTRLELGRQAVGDAPITETLALFGRLPSGVMSLQVAGNHLGWTAVERGEEGPCLTVVIPAHFVEATAAELHRLSPAQLGSLKVIFAKGGFFTKRTRPGLQNLIREATRHLPRCDLQLD